MKKNNLFRAETFKRGKHYNYLGLNGLPVLLHGS